MTDVVSVSAVTAAYAVEPVKPGQRVTGTGRMMEAVIKDWAAEAARTDDPRQKILLNVVRPPALALFMLTSQNNKPHPEASREHVEAAYRETMAMAPGTDAADRTDEAAAAETRALNEDHDKARQAEANQEARDTASYENSRANQSDSARSSSDEGPREPEGDHDIDDMMSALQASPSAASPNQTTQTAQAADTARLQTAFFT